MLLVLPCRWNRSCHKRLCLPASLICTAGFVTGENEAVLKVLSESTVVLQYVVWGGLEPHCRGGCQERKEPAVRRWNYTQIFVRFPQKKPGLFLHGKNRPGLICSFAKVPGRKLISCTQAGSWHGGQSLRHGRKSLPWRRGSAPACG